VDRRDCILGFSILDGWNLERKGGRGVEEIEKLQMEFRFIKIFTP
jgi:hypothetical protein